MRSRLAHLVVLVLLLAACGGGDDDAAAEDTTTTSPPETTTTEAEAGVGLAETSLGEVVVGPEGMTLYGFTVDDPRMSNCYDDCAQVWPPLSGDTPVGDGLDAALFSTTERDDGTTQLVMSEWPLYYFAGDSAPGDVNGQGVEGVWFAITADGQLVGASAADDTGGSAATTAGDSVYDESAEAEGVTVGETELGPTLVDADGMTLYGFTRDSATSSECSGPCADNWPPVSGETTVSGELDASLVSTIDRGDGTTQLVFGEWPLYRFAGDSSPGDVNGHGVNEVWYVIGPDGELYR